MVMNVGDAAGHQLGEAQVEGTMDAGRQPVISFQVVETLLGTTEDPGAEVGPAAVAVHANPQLAAFDPECMPALSEPMKAFMETKEARYWLNQFTEGMASEEMICNRFGTEALEVFQMWLAIRDDVDMHVRNCADAARHVADTVCGEGGEDSDATTVAAGGEGKEGTATAKKGYVAPLAARDVAGDSDQDQDEGDQECDDREGVEAELEPDAIEAVAEHGAVPSMAGEGAALGHGSDREASHEAGMAEDTVDPLTGIPSKWAAFWRATNQNASIGVGLPDPVRPAHLVAEGSLSDGYGTLPGNDAESADVEAASAVAAAESTSEQRATSSTDGKKQLDLKGWLK